METISLSQALPQDPGREDLAEGLSFAITAIHIEPRSGKGKTWETAAINGLALPDLDKEVKYKTSSGPVVKQLKDLLVCACFADGATKKPVRVHVSGRDGQNGRYLILEDA